MKTLGRKDDIKHSKSIEEKPVDTSVEHIKNLRTKT